MLRKLLPGALFPAAAPPAAIPAGERVYAIGDVHGCLDQLERLLAAIDADGRARAPARTTLVLLGDVVDRGPASAQVVALLMKIARTTPRMRLLKGNHEEVMLLALDGDEQALRLFCRIGGRETLLSYGLSADDYERLDYAELAALLPDLVPAAHRTFLESFEDVVVAGDYAFVHAGVRPNLPLDLQSVADLRWIRGPFLDFRGRHEKMIVHGHTVTPEVDRRAGRIGVDTGAYVGGPLTALALEGTSDWVLQV